MGSQGGPHGTLGPIGLLGHVGSLEPIGHSLGARVFGFISPGRGPLVYKIGESKKYALT